MSISSKPKRSEAFNYEVNRRMDEAKAIINYACDLFAKKYKFKAQLEEINSIDKSKWAWAILIFAVILDFILSDSTLFEHKWTWNFGSGLLAYCLFVYFSKSIEARFVKFQIKGNQEKLEELVFRFDAVTRLPLDLWSLEGLIDSNGEFKDGYSIDSPYYRWIRQIEEMLETRINFYSENSKK
jgi:hypothetical protein